MRNRKTVLLVIAVISTIQLLIACGRLSSEQRTAANDALKALRKIQAATQAGVNHQQYSQLVIDAKAAVNESSLKLPNGELKQELQEAIEAYMDAGDGMSLDEEMGYIMIRDPFGDKTALRLKEKYKFKTFDEGDPLESVTKKSMLTAIWQEAAKHLDRASSLL